MIPVFQFCSCKKYSYMCIPNIWSCSLRSFDPASALARVFYSEHPLELSQSLCFYITISSTKVFTNCCRHFFWQKSVLNIWLGAWRSRDGETNAKMSEMLLFTLEDRCNCSTETHHHKGAFKDKRLIDESSIFIISMVSSFLRDSYYGRISLTRSKKFW